MSDKKGDDVLTTGQVMDEYKISRTALWRLSKQGILKPVDGDSLLTHPHENTYRRSDIEAAIKAIAERKKNRRRKPSQTTQD